MGDCEDALEDQDVVAFQHNLVREEFSCLKILRVVGYIVVNEPAVFDLPLGVRSHVATLMVLDEVVHLDSDSDEDASLREVNNFQRYEFLIRPP